jgi:hypothetical protein
MDIPMAQGRLLQLDDAVAKEMEASITYSLLREDISWTVIAKVTAAFMVPVNAGIGIELARIPMMMTYEKVMAAFRNEVNRKFPPQMSSTTKARRNINKVGSGRGRGGRFGRADHGGCGQGGPGGRGNRGRPAKKRSDSSYITLSDGQEVEYHASFNFPPAIFNKMKDADRERMLRKRKEYNKSRDQNRDQSQQIQQLQPIATQCHTQCQRWSEPASTTSATPRPIRHIRRPSFANQSLH